LHGNGYRTVLLSCHKSPEKAKERQEELSRKIGGRKIYIREFQKRQKKGEVFILDKNLKVVE
jgi:hypothetical protein